MRDELAILIGPHRCAYIQPVLRWANENVLELECQTIGEHYGRYRLHLPEAERAMARSLERYGQLSPVVVCQRQQRYELIDGFKRLGAARTGTHLPSVGPAARGRRAHGQGCHLRAQSRRWPHAGVGRSLDHSGVGAGRRDEPGGSGRAAGTPQELGVPAPGADRAVGAQGARRPARRPVVAHGGATDGAVAGGQPGGSPGGDPARGAVQRGVGSGGGSVAGAAPSAASNSTCCSIRAKRCRRPKERSRQCAIRD